MSAFSEWRKRREARETLRAGDPWVCPYCRAVHPTYEVGGTRFGFGYPSAKLACCGKVAFVLKDPKTQELMSFTRVGDGHADWMPKDDYFAWLEASKTPRGYRDASPHAGKLERPAPGTRAPATGQREQGLPAAEPSPGGAAVARPIAFVAVAKVGELKPDQGRVVVVNGQRIALFNVGGKLHATQDACRHQGRSLGDSSCEDGIVTCNGHGWRYDVRTGAAQHNPEIALQRYEVKVEGDTVFVAA